MRRHGEDATCEQGEASVETIPANTQPALPPWNGGAESVIAITQPVVLHYSRSSQLTAFPPHRVIHICPPVRAQGPGTHTPGSCCPGERHGSVKSSKRAETTSVPLLAVPAGLDMVPSAKVKRKHEQQQLFRNVSPAPVDEHRWPGEGRGWGLRMDCSYLGSRMDRPQQLDSRQG